MQGQDSKPNDKSVPVSVLRELVEHWKAEASRAYGLAKLRMKYAETGDYQTEALLAERSTLDQCASRLEKLL